MLGTPFTGFNLDMQQGYDISKALLKPVVIELGIVKCKIGADNPSRRPSDVAGSVTSPGAEQESICG